MRVVFWGTYESQYDRNRILVSGLRAAGVEVVEIHSPVLEKSRFKTDALKSPFKLMSLGFRFIVSFGSLIIRYLRTSNHDIMFVGYLGYLDILNLDL